MSSQCNPLLDELGPRLTHNRSAETRIFSFARTAILRSLTSLSGGANLQVLRTYYVQAVRSVIDYAAPALTNLSHQQWKKLEVAQNNAMRAALGAPMWTRLETLRLETGLPSLQERISQRTATIISKIIISSDPIPVRQAVVVGLGQNNGNSWVARAGKVVNRLHLKSMILGREGDHPHPNYTLRTVGRAYFQNCNRKSPNEKGCL